MLRHNIAPIFICPPNAMTIFRAVSHLRPRLPTCFRVRASPARKNRGALPLHHLIEKLKESTMPRLRYRLRILAGTGVCGRVPGGWRYPVSSHCQDIEKNLASPEQMASSGPCLSDESRQPRIRGCQHNAGGLMRVLAPNQNHDSGVHPNLFGVIPVQPKARKSIFTRNPNHAEKFSVFTSLPRLYVKKCQQTMH